MSKPWIEKPLWEKCYLSPHGSVYLNAGSIIHHAGTTGFAFYDKAKLLPDWNKLLYENAVRDLTVFAPRERGEYVLHATAKKVLRIVLGPAPDAPDYRSWWEARLVSVEMLRKEGKTVLWAAEPPVPIAPTAEPQEAPKPKKPRSRKRAG